jgi:hypothetical protein
VEGLGDVLPLNLLPIFNEHELELLIGGITEIDMDDWTRFTDYRGYEKTDGHRPRDRVVLGVLALVASGMLGALTVFCDGHVEGARYWV